MEHDETGCQPPLEGPILCVNNCGFFGSPANMNLCSKCYKDIILKQEQAKLAASSIENFVNGSSCGGDQESSFVDAAVVRADSVEVKATQILPFNASSSIGAVEPKTNRCWSCKKRVGLTGFNCRCGNIFCTLHRYSDMHNCPFDYRTAGRDAIAKANPVVMAEKLDKI